MDPRASTQSISSPVVKRKFRLKKSTEFKRVRRYGRTYAHPLLVLIALPNDQESSRFGFVAGRVVGNAVNRNRAKRMMRAAIQPLVGKISPGWDVILVARPLLPGASLAQIQSALDELQARAKLFSDLR